VVTTLDHDEIASRISRVNETSRSLSRAVNRSPAAFRHVRPALCIVGNSSVRLWSRNTADRLVIQFARAGIDHVLDPEQAALGASPVIMVRADAVLDQPLVRILIERSSFILASGAPGRQVPIAAHVLPSDAISVAGVLGEGRLDRVLPHLDIHSPEDLDAAFWQSLRKREVPYALLVDASNKAEVEWRSFMGTYKGATDVVTKRLWPVPAFHVTRALAETSITPNVVTALAALLVFVAFYCFLYGHYLPGLIAAWMMTFLDTVDGKLARTTLTASKWGDVFDHGIDLIHPPFWYVAWALGLSTIGVAWTSSTFWWVIGIILGGYVLQRAMEGIAIKWLGMEIHIWRPIDTHFREITARRNPNLVLLTLSLFVSRPDLGLIAVAAWTGICLILHAVQLAQAFSARARSGKLSSWMSEPPTIK
jgi:phosphatidylglycerophosphate synthase